MNSVRALRHAEEGEEAGEQQQQNVPRRSHVAFTFLTTDVTQRRKDAKRGAFRA
jgi:hypothetical protein